MLELDLIEKDVLSIPWSNWAKADSLDEGITKARSEIGKKWPFQGSLNGAVAYLGKTTTTVAEICEVVENGTSVWKYRYRRP